MEEEEEEEEEAMLLGVNAANYLSSERAWHYSLHEENSQVQRWAGTTGAAEFQILCKEQGIYYSTITKLRAKRDKTHCLILQSERNLRLFFYVGETDLRSSQKSYQSLPHPNSQHQQLVICIWVFFFLLSLPAFPVFPRP